MARERCLRGLTLSLMGLIPALLLIGYFNAAQLQVATAAVSEEEDRDLTNVYLRDALSQTIILTHTIYTPLVQRNCQSMLADDFSDPTSGWPVGATSFGKAYYDRGVYRLVDDIPGYTLFGGVSPDWMVPNDAVIKVDTWIDDAPSGVGILPSQSLVFGLQLYPVNGNLLWIDWYEFRVSPGNQYYRVWKWHNRGNNYDVLTSGYSSAIFPELDTVQTLEVRRNGNAITLVVNGTVLETIVDSTNPYAGRRSVGVGAGDFYSVGYDNFEVRASGCITTPTTSAATSCAMED